MLNVKIASAGRTILLLAFLCLAGRSAIAAPRMEWGLTAVHTHSPATCMRFASDAMRLQNMQIVPPPASRLIMGTSGGTTAAISCAVSDVDNGKVVATIVVAGDNEAEINQVTTALSNRLNGMVAID
jgi:hypothetical protein